MKKLLFFILLFSFGLIICSTALAATTIKKVAVILVNFQNDTTQPYDLNTIKSITFDNPPAHSVKAYFQEVTFDKWAIQGAVEPNGDVFGWYTIPYNNTDNCIENYMTWAMAAKTLAMATGFNPNQYTNIVYLFSHLPGCTSWWGLGSVGGDQGISFINGSYGYIAGVVNHELGHNFGLNHAHSYYCTNANGQPIAISKNCINIEYGDPFDAMGAAVDSRQFSNAHRGTLGIFNSLNIRDINKDGLYAIAPVEYASNTVQVLRIPSDVDVGGNVLNYYYIEFRRPYGFDTGGDFDGIFIRLAGEYNTYSGPFLIDTTPQDARGDFWDAALKLNQTFQDPLAGISITTASISDTGAMVNVGFTPPQCSQANPTLRINPRYRTGSPAQTLTYTLTLTNTDKTACGVSTYNVTPILPAGWTQNPASLSLNLNPGESVTRAFSITSSSTASPYIYNSFTENAVNIANNAFQASASGNYLVVPYVQNDGLPDLAVTNFTVAPFNVMLGDQVTATATFQNFGNGNCSSAEINLLDITTNVSLLHETVNFSTDGQSLQRNVITTIPETAVSGRHVFEASVHCLGDTDPNVYNDIIDQTFIIHQPTTVIVNANAESGGTISPSGEVRVDFGKDQIFTITPDAGNKPLVFVDGAVINEVFKNDNGTYRYTFSNVRVTHTITVSFTKTSFSLTKSGSGQGTIVSTPAGINCGNICQYFFSIGTVLTLTATPDSISTFAGWSGVCAGQTGSTCTVTLNDAQNVNATFSVIPVALTINKTGDTAAMEVSRITSAPAGIDCGSQCVGAFHKGTDVTLTASYPNTVKFNGWGPSACASNPTCNFMLNQDEVLNLQFVNQNLPPVFPPNVIRNRAVREKSPLNTSSPPLGRITDPEGQAITLLARLADGSDVSSIGMTFTDLTNGRGSFRWTPTVGQGNKDYTIVLVASDPQGNTSQASVLQIHVDPVTPDLQASVINVTPNPTINSATITGTVKVVNNGDLAAAVSTVTLSNNLTIPPVQIPALEPGQAWTQSFSYQVPQGFVAVNESKAVTFTASVASIANEVDRSPNNNTASILVPVFNRPPSLATSVSSVSVNPGQLAQLTLTASDPDTSLGDKLKRISLDCGSWPTGATLTENDNGQAIFQWTPQANQVGDYPLTFKVTDSNNNTARVEVMVRVRIPMDLTVSFVKWNVISSTTAEYTIRVSTNGVTGNALPVKVNLNYTIPEWGLFDYNFFNGNILLTNLASGQQEYKGMLDLYSAVEFDSITFSINAQVDPENEYIETNENNNTSSAVQVPPYNPMVLAINKSGNGMGSIRTNNDYAVEGNNCDGQCQYNLQQGAIVTLIATPQAGSNFAGWSGACAGQTGAKCTITMNNTATVGAQFTSGPTNLVATVNKSKGTVALIWTAPAGGNGAGGYQIYRNGQAIGTSLTTSYTDKSRFIETCTAPVKYYVKGVINLRAGTFTIPSNDYEVPCP